MAITIDGVSGVTFPDSSTQTTANYGANQSWQSFTVGSTRIIGSGSPYTNGTGKTIMVSILATGNGTQQQVFSGYVNNVEVSRGGASFNSGGAGMTFLVPPGATYYITTTGASINGWLEFR